MDFRYACFFSCMPQYPITSKENAPAKTIAAEQTIQHSMRCVRPDASFAKTHPLMQREYDIIIYGASGYTAKHVIKQLVNEKVRLALAGRSAQAIKKNVVDVKDSEKIPVLECSPEKTRRITCKTRVLLNCAGPYIFSGEDIVKACVETGTHYLDITGETFFIESILKRYDESARQKKIYIVNCCGFDSIPADVGVEYLKKELGGDCEIMSVMRLHGAYVNRTTYDSLIFALQNAEEMRKLRGAPKKKTKKGLRKYFYNEKTGSYNVIFMGTDPSVVRRTQDRMQDNNLGFCEYQAYLDVGSYFYLTLFKFYFLLIMLLSRSGLGRKLLLKFPALFTHGRVRSTRPTEGMLKKSSFEILFFGKTADGSVEKKMIVRGPDSGYYTTSICLTQAALCLLGIVEAKEVPIFAGGVITPACLFHGSDLVDRLQKKGIRFEVVGAEQ